MRNGAALAGAECLAQTILEHDPVRQSVRASVVADRSSMAARCRCSLTSLSDRTMPLIVASESRFTPSTSTARSPSPVTRVSQYAVTPVSAPASRAR